MTTDRPHRVLVADDELPSRRYVCELTRQDPRFQVVADCENGPTTVTEARLGQPDLMFLDIQMPGMNGFEVVEATQGCDPLIVFVTAHSDYALRAFELEAFDYVKKPIDPERFSRVLDRAAARIEEKKSAHPPLTYSSSGDGATSRRVHSAQQDPKLLHAVRQDLVYRERDVEFVESAGNYVNVHIKGDTYLVRDSLDNFCSQLSATDFLRVHRSFVVNIRCVLTMRYGKSGSAELEVPGGHVIPVSRGRRKQVAATLRRVNGPLEVNGPSEVEEEGYTA